MITAGETTPLRKEQTMAGDNLVEVRHLSHRYGPRWAVESVSFTIGERGVIGLLGSNGAGKSTTMNILCGVLTPTSGKVFINGMDLHRQPEKAKALIGFLPQSAPLHNDFTVDEYLIHCAHLRLIPPEAIPAALLEVKQRCGLADVGRRLIGNLSGGYRQRVGMAQAVVHKPRLVVLDEPTNGLDPNQIVEVRRLIKEIAEDRAVLFSSHILPEIRATCRDIIMMELGRLVFVGPMTAFNDQLGYNTLLLSMSGPIPLSALRAVPGVATVEQLDHETVRVTVGNSPDLAERLIEISVTCGWRLRELVREKASLESVFAHLSKRVPVHHS